MDEQRLSELFRDAAGVAPPPSFDSDDVVGASRRVTARRRSAIAGGSLFGVALLSGGLLFGGQVFQSTSTGEPAAAESAPEAPAAGPPVADRMLEPTPMLAPPEPACGLADPALTAGLAEVVADGPPVAFPEPCPPGFRGSGVAVPGGTVYALLGPDPLRADEVPGYVSTPAGDEVLSLVSVPAEPGAPPPLADDLDDLAEQLADGL